MTRLSNIVIAAGLVSPQPDAVSKLLSAFGEKILTIVSHAGRFRDMVSGMISGEFEVFAVQPGAAFDGESMVDMNEDKVTPRGTGAAQKVLCVYRVGLRKQMGKKIMTVIKAEVVLESFLG
jgi:TRAP-type mannitol/chloroaromatic compound transport system substrate-binding protein